VYEILKDMPDESIYDGYRLSLPDEVWNFKRGDGIEKALLLADFILLKDNSKSLKIEINNHEVNVYYNEAVFSFVSYKKLSKLIEIFNNDYKIV
jgi:hypothetical protein